MLKNNLEIIILKKEGISDFAKERNNLLAKSKAEWVFFVDTDETLTEELKSEIKKLDVQGFDGFYVKRKIIFLGKEVGEDKVLRIGKRDAGKWERKVHETWKIKGKVGTLRGYIIHNTALDLSSYIEKMNKYSDLHARENMREGKRASLFKIIFYPKAKFLQNFLKGRGFVFSMLQSFHSFLGWSKLWELQRKSN